LQLKLFFLALFFVLGARWIGFLFLLKFYFWVLKSSTFFRERKNPIKFAFSKKVFFSLLTGDENYRHKEFFR